MGHTPTRTIKFLNLKDKISLAFVNETDPVNQQHTDVYNKCMILLSQMGLSLLEMSKEIWAAAKPNLGMQKAEYSLTIRL